LNLAQIIDILAKDCPTVSSRMLLPIYYEYFGRFLQDATSRRPPILWLRTSPVFPGRCFQQITNIVAKDCPVVSRMVLPVYHEYYV
jgi:hypothetical protein